MPSRQTTHEAAATSSQAQSLDGGSRGVALDRLLRLARSVGGEFLSEAASARLARIPDVFGETFSWCGLECRLDGTDQVDVMTCVEQRDARHLALELARPPWTEAWAHEAEWIRGWAASSTPVSPYLWFEFDLPPTRDENDVPVLLFVPFEVEIGSRPAGDRTQRVISEAHLLSAAGISGATEKKLRQVIDALPSSGWPLHLASLAKRALSGCRLVVSVPRHEAPAYLRAIGWGGSIAELRAVLDRVATFNSHVNLSFDVATEVGTRLGIDCFFPTLPLRDPRWHPVLELLAESGARLPLLAAFSEWYGELATTEGTVFRNPFIKLVIDEGHPTTGKAYLAFHPDTRNPGVTTSAIRATSPMPHE